VKNKIQKCREIFKETYKGIPRKEIQWFPIVDYEKCVSCGKCVDYCKLGVYRLDVIKKKSRHIAVNPYNCVVLCKGCQYICPSGAISHTSRNETIALIRRKRQAQ